MDTGIIWPRVLKDTKTDSYGLCARLFGRVIVVLFWPFKDFEVASFAADGISDGRRHWWRRQ